MKIGLVTNMMDGRTAGIGRYTKNLVENLLKIDKKNNYVLIHSNQCHYDFKGNYTEIRLPFFTTIPRKLIVGAFIFEKLCHEQKLDILHDLGQISPFFFQTKTKKILTLFDLTPTLFPQNFSIYSKYYTKLFPLVLKNSDKIITISKSSKKDLANIFTVPESKIEISYLGVENKFNNITNNQTLKQVRQRYNLPKDFILFVGTIEPRKNLANLISAYYLFRKKYNLQLVIVGKKGWKYDEVFHTIDKLGLHDEIRVVGYVKDDDLPSFYNLAKVFVYPSIYEGFGLPILEAMASGCPVIASNSSSMPEVIGDAGILINPEKLDKELPSSLKKILKSTKMREKLIKKGMERAKQFTWQKTARETIKVYEELF